MRLTWPVLYLFLFAYRCAVSVIAFPVVTQFTTLGDARRYSGAARYAFTSGTYKSSTAMTDTIGVIFQSVSGGSPAMVSLCFQTLAFIGIVRFLNAIPAKERVIALVLVAFPSFTLWSSVPSKESVIVFALGFVGAYLIRAYRGEFRLGVLEVIAIYLAVLYKPQYFAGLGAIFVSIVAFRTVKQKALAALIGALAPLPFLFIFRNQLSGLAFEVQTHFIGTGRSTRESFFIDQYDVFARIPAGFFASFFGPMWAETSLSIIHRIAFIESAVLAAALLAIVLFRNVFAIPVYSVIVSLSSLFWILFGTFPFGVMNSGTAIRYRTGYFLVIVLIVIVFSSREMYVSNLRKEGGRATRVS